MAKIIPALIGSLALFISSQSYAATFLKSDWRFEPDVGVDFGVRSQRFDEGYGKEHFRKAYPLSNIYAAARVHEYFGFEGGYERMHAVGKKQFYKEDTVVLGFLTSAPNISGDQTFESELWSQGWNVNLVGYVPIFEKTTLTGSVGAVWSKIHYNTSYVADLDQASRPTQWQSKNQGLLRLTLGLRQMITEIFGLRLQAAWENTSKLSANALVDADNLGAALPGVFQNYYHAKPKDSYAVNLGFFLTFN